MRNIITIFLLILTVMNACKSAGTKKQSTDHLTEEAVAMLKKVMDEQQEWVKVHAAEFLIWTGHDQGVKQVYLNELDKFGSKPPYRIGIWRVLTQVSAGNEAETYRKNIRDAFLDTAGKDRIHAIETMAKLKMSPLPAYKQLADEALMSDIKSLAGYTHWSVAYTNADSLVSAKKYFLERILDAGEDILLKRIAAYVLRNSGSLNPGDWHLLKEAVLAMPSDAEGRISFLNAALLTAPEDGLKEPGYAKLSEQFLAYSQQKDKAARMDIAAGLAMIGSKEQLPLLTEWMRNANATGNPADDADVQASAAYAIIKINERLKTPG